MLHVDGKAGNALFDPAPELSLHRVFSCLWLCKWDECENGTERDIVNVHGHTKCTAMQVPTGP